MTGGEAGIATLPPRECAPVREAEQRADLVLTGNYHDTWPGAAGTTPMNGPRFGGRRAVAFELLAV